MKIWAAFKNRAIAFCFAEFRGSNLEDTPTDIWTDKPLAEWTHLIGSIVGCQFNRF